MNVQKFSRLARAGESYTVEYKTCTESVSESVYESVCAFLNHSGGCILLGVSDNDTIGQLHNYTKNPLLVRIFRELAWAEDMGSGTRNIVKYAPLYFPEYKVDINSGSQFIFSVTYNEMSETNVHNNSKMSMTESENVHDNSKMSETNVRNITEMSETDFEIVRDKKDVKKNKRQQAIVGLIKKNPLISLDDIADILDVNKKTIWRDISELKANNVLERLGGDFGGKWIVK